VLACNRDDHVRNFSFLMSAAGEWRISPAYDLIYSEGMRGHHTTAVDGQTLSPTQDHVLRVGAAHGLGPRQALAVIEQVRSSVADFRKIARGLSVAAATVAQVARRLDEVGTQFGGARARARAKPRTRARRKT